MNFTVPNSGGNVVSNNNDNNLNNGGLNKGNQNLEKKTPNESSNRGEWGSGAIRGEGGKGSGSVGPYGKNKRNKGAAPERTGSNASKAKTGRGNWI